MLRIVLTLTAAATIASGALSAPCKDPKTGKFIKCPPPVSAPAGTRCKDAKGKFAKCGTPGATPVVAKK